MTKRRFEVERRTLPARPKHKPLSRKPKPDERTIRDAIDFYKPVPADRASRDALGRTFIGDRDLWHVVCLANILPILRKTATHTIVELMSENATTDQARYSRRHRQGMKADLAAIRDELVELRLVVQKALAKHRPEQQRERTS